MSFIEITGQPCAGKTSFIAQQIIKHESFRIYEHSYPIKFLSFVIGIKYLGFARTKILLSWALKETAPFLFRVNIFFNAVAKFGKRSNLITKQEPISPRYLVDEGLSHLPFLFLNTDSEEVIDFISREVRDLDVYFVKSPGCEIIRDRLRIRGHKRLKFLAISVFVQRNDEIEKVLHLSYPDLVKKIKFF
jgi:hypothetical protein